MRQLQNPGMQKKPNFGKLVSVTLDSAHQDTRIVLLAYNMTQNIYVSAFISTKQCHNLCTSV